MAILGKIRALGNRDIKSFFSSQPQQGEIKETLAEKGYYTKTNRDRVEAFLSEAYGADKESIDYGLYIWDQSELDRQAKETERKLRSAMADGKAQIVNRYNAQVTETVDPGIYGYSTRDEVRIERGDEEIERWLKDPKVRASFEVLSSQIFSDPLTVEAVNESEEAQTLKKYIDSSFNEMQGSIRKSLKEAFRVAMSFQNAFFEKVPNWSVNPEFKGKRILSRLASKRPGLLEFITDDYDNVLAVHSLVNFDDYYPLSRFFIVSFNNMFSNPYGETVFAGTYKFWKAKLIVFQEMAVYANRYAQPIPTVTYKDGDQAAKAQELSNKLYGGLNIALPEGVKAEFLKGIEGGSSNPYTPILEYLDKQISLGICGIDLSQGSYAADKVISEERGQIVLDVREALEESVFEQIIKPDCLANFDNSKYTINDLPRVKFRKKKPPITAEEMTKAIPVLVDNDFIDPDSLNDKNKIRLFYDFSELTEEELEDREEEAEEEEEELPELEEG